MKGKTGSPKRIGTQYATTHRYQNRAFLSASLDPGNSAQISQIQQRVQTSQRNPN